MVIKKQFKNNKKGVPVSLLNKLEPDEFNRVMRDFLFKKNQASRDEIARFCEHDGICIKFTRAG
ncbi:MAG: hypothetical protein RQ982_08655, partial [Gammaproteobacteria bacterium]|nr:hypothetical protein [Gammaproteobacteria bacterium]